MYTDTYPDKLQNQPYTNTYPGNLQNQKHTMSFFLFQNGGRSMAPLNGDESPPTYRSESSVISHPQLLPAMASGDEHARGEVHAVKEEVRLLPNSIDS
jgi:hypothetical protein